jgi:GNAT superfamily N-acetyltransferase
VTVREINASGRAAVDLVARLLQRARLADREAGIWEASDVQWWTRKPRASDVVDQVFWVDDQGPVAGVYLTQWGERWQADPLHVPGAAGPAREAVWEVLREQVRTHVPAAFEVLVRDDDEVTVGLATHDGLVPGERSGQAWLHVNERPEAAALPDGYVIVDRMQRADVPHWMRHRNGDEVAERLGQCSVYDPRLDLAVQAPDGEMAGYSLFWADPVTGCGEVEPVRTEDAHQRRGLATAMITAGLQRLAEQGVTWVKIGYGEPGAGYLYRSLGFRDPASLTAYERPS